MNKTIHTIVALVFVTLFMGTSALAQSVDFESDEIGDSYGVLGWDTSADITAEVADDPVSSGNNVLEVTINNYNAAPVVEITIPDGNTLADYDSFKFKGYFEQGDVGYKDIIVQAWEEEPSGAFANDEENPADVDLGSWNRAVGGSTEWEDITVDISNDSDLSGSIYIAFGINADGTGDEGGDGSTTMWYADDVELEEATTSATGLISEWGVLGGRAGWPVTSVTEGGATISGDPLPPTWATIRGAFPDTLTATTNEPLVVSGQMEIQGADAEVWSALRFGVFHHDSAGTLQYAGTDSVSWTGSESLSSGYLFTPQTGAAGGIGWACGGNANYGPIDNANWISTNNDGTSCGIARLDAEPAPENPVLTQGTYDFAISVKPLEDGTNELSFYLVKDDNSYWFAATDIDTLGVTDTYNGVVFGMINDVESSGLALSNVSVELGTEITIPEKPFASFFVSNWGTIGGREGWPILNDSTTFNGIGMMGGEPEPETWATMRGGFGGEVDATEEEAIIASGEIELVGGDATVWGPIRFGIFQHDDAGALNNQYTDSAKWGYTQYADTDSASFVSNEGEAYGYLFTPQTGEAGGIGWACGGNQTQGVINNASWITTNAGEPSCGQGGDIQPIPKDAIMVEGTYDFAISVQPQADGTNEVRWYMIEEDEAYWYGGSFIDTLGVTTTFNGVVFGAINDVEISGMNVDVQIDRGAPIEVPIPPFYDHYIAVDSWGFVGDRFGGDWTLTPGDFSGNTTISGSAATELAAVRGGFDVPSTPTSNSEGALVVDGSVNLEEGSFEDGDFKFGIFNASDPGSVDSTEANGYVWTGSENQHSGYLINPGEGTVTGIANGVWHDEMDDGAYSVASDISSSGSPSAGTYNFYIAAQPTSEGMEITFQLEKDDESYIIEGGVLDDNDPVATEVFNGISFATNNSTTTGLTIEDVQARMEMAVSNEDEGRSNQPTTFSLEQNYPNPFNPSTKINYSVPQTSDVKIEVYDIMGRLVSTLVNETKTTGTYTVNFNASNFASGMYIYRITAGSFVSTKKMMLIK